MRRALSIAGMLLLLAALQALRELMEWQAASFLPDDHKPYRIAGACRNKASSVQWQRAPHPVICKG